MSQNTERVVLYIDSSRRLSGTSENFTIQLQNKIDKIQQAEVFSAEVPYTFYGITSTTNQITWVDGSETQYTASISPGNYPITTFINTLQSSMNAVMPGFTIAYIKETYKLRFQNSTTFRIASVGTTMAKKIGLTGPTTASTSVVMPGVVNLSGPRYLLIKSQRLTRPKITRPFSNSAQDDILYKIPISGGPGDIMIEKNIYTNLLKYGVRQTIDILDFQLTDEDHNQIDLNGLDWSLSVNLVLG